MVGAVEDAVVSYKAISRIDSRGGPWAPSVPWREHAGRGPTAGTDRSRRFWSCWPQLPAL